MQIDISLPIYVHFMNYLLLFLLIVFIYSKTPVFKRVYRRNDDTINYPLYKMTLTVRSVVLLTTILPMLFFMISENASFFGNSPLIAKFLYGQLIVTALVAFFKKATAKLRPHFLALNGIEFDAKDTAFYYDKNSNYVQNLRESFMTQESRCSFFSGHAASGAFGAAFLLLYLQNYMIGNSLLKPLIMLIVLIAMLFPGLSQYQNYWHHATDIAAGYAIGAAIGCYSYFVML